MTPKVIHVLPVDDLIEHERTTDCVCGPLLCFYGPRLIVTHHSLDGRELVEVLEDPNLWEAT